MLGLSLYSCVRVLINCWSHSSWHCWSLSSLGLFRERCCQFRDCVKIFRKHRKLFFLLPCYPKIWPPSRFCCGPYSVFTIHASFRVSLLPASYFFSFSYFLLALVNAVFVRVYSTVNVCMCIEWCRFILFNFLIVKLCFYMCYINQIDEINVNHP